MRRALPILVLCLALPWAAAAQAPRDARLIMEPGPEDFRRVYPREAAERSLSAEVVLGCAVETNGTASDCEVLAENPTGYGFADAALALLPHYSYSPAESGGTPVRARTYINIGFEPPEQNFAGRYGLLAAVVAAWVLAVAAWVAIRRRRTLSKSKEQT